MSKELQCKDCNSVFFLTDKDVAFYQEKMAQDPQWSMPKRCKRCRQKNKLNREASNYPPQADYNNSF